MLTETEYDRRAALDYAQKWALGRNSAWLDFEHLGGDCTNFASQCLYAGSKVMNPTPVMGWYYNSARDRTASWTGVQYLYNFLVNNRSTGPYAAETDSTGIEPGDLIQLGNRLGYYHTPIVAAVENGRILVAAHTYDAWRRPLDTYLYEKARFLHILGVRKMQGS